MKKITSLLCIMILLFVCSNTSIKAEQSVLQIPTLNMQLTVPNTWLAITRNTKATDPVFTILGLKQSTTLKEMKQRDTYLEMYDSTLTYQMGITMTTDDSSKKIKDFQNISDYDLSGYMQMEQSSSKAQGIIYDKYNEYTTDQAKFMVFEGTIQKTGTHLLQYMTIKNGQRINIMALSNQTIPSTVTQAANELIDSIKFLPTTKAKNEDAKISSDTSNATDTKTSQQQQNATNSADHNFNLCFGIGSIVFIIVLSSIVILAKRRQK